MKFKKPITRETGSTVPYRGKDVPLMAEFHDRYIRLWPKGCREGYGMQYREMYFRSALDDAGLSRLSPAVVKKNLHGQVPD